MAKAGEQRLFQAFVTQASVEALDEAVLLRLAWRDVMPLDVTIPRPSQDRQTNPPDCPSDRVRAILRTGTLVFAIVSDRNSTQTVRSLLCFKTSEIRDFW